MVPHLCRVEQKPFVEDLQNHAKKQYHRALILQKT